jgi:hypothetical protein
MGSRGYYQIVWLLEGIVKTFEDLDDKMNGVLCDKASDKKMECYLDIVSEKADAIITLAEKVKELTRDDSEEETLLRALIADWEKEAKEYLLLPKAYRVPCILDQNSKDQIRMFAKL